ncbi:MAG TPA: GTP cyclohydrolase II [Candidatus Binatia bacterium]|nr:GTP cyclohydrolase II [Candidatus Binatia bacterium]
MKKAGATDFSRLRAALDAFAAGQCVVLHDDAHPEAGGYVCCPGNAIDDHTINFMVTHARGHVCVTMNEARMRAFGIPLLASDAPFSRGVAFGASIEAREGVSTGISAADRARTIRVASTAEPVPGAVIMPGHVFPVQVRTGGVLIRPGLPEAAADLSSMSVGVEAAAMCAVLDENGDLASPEELARMAKEFHLVEVTVADVVAERLRSELVVERVAERDIEVGEGTVFRAIVYRNDLDQDEHMALANGDLSGDEPVWVRVHSQCLTGDVLGSTRCDCGDQLDLALKRIADAGRGVIIYMHQEGRGIGLANKIRAYALQDCGRDTVEANLELGFGEDLRDYAITAQIIRDLGIRRVRLLTNNPQKIEGLERYGVDVVARDSIEAEARADNIHYLRTKRRKLGHLLDDSSWPLGQPERRK